MWLPLILLAAGAGTLIALAFSNFDVVPDHKPDAPATPGKTGYHLVDAILPDLKAASQSSGYPLGLLVGWICKESGGKLGEVTKLDERGYFQLMPDESKRLGLDHQRLSTDSVYSINGGLLLIGLYSQAVDALNVARKGSKTYWALCKLGHTMGGGALKKIVADAKAAGQAGSWDQIEDYALANNDQILHETKHSPSKWFPFIDSIIRIGEPFGFGDESGPQAIVGGLGEFADIVDPLDALRA